MVTILSQRSGEPTLTTHFESLASPQAPGSSFGDSLLDPWL